MISLFNTVTVIEEGREPVIVTAPVAARAADPRSWASIPGHWATPERVAYLRWAWPGGVPATDLRAELERLGGSPIPSQNNLNTWVFKKLGLRRPDGFMSAVAVAREGAKRATGHEPPIPRKPTANVTRSLTALRGTPALAVGQVPGRAPGRCAWPLTCDAPAVGMWCEGHLALRASHA